MKTNIEEKGGYTPLPSENAKVRYEYGKLLLSGDKIFHTIQGEGPLIGYPMTFIRLQGCNLRCTWCDTPYTFRKDMKEYYEAENYTYKEILEKVGNRDIVLTGGEPLIQQDGIIQLLDLVKDSRKVQIETNGTMMPDDIILNRCSIVCSPKIDYQKLYRKEVIDKYISAGTYFKFVCRNEIDFKIVKFFVKSFSIPKDKVYIMPEGITVEQNIEAYSKIRDLIISEGYKTTPRLQNIMWNGALRGV